MRNKKVDRLLAPAMEIVAEYLEVNDVVAKEYNGYISSFGATVIQCGIKPATALYLNTNSDSDASKIKLIYCILKLAGVEKLTAWDNKNESELAKDMLIKVLNLCNTRESELEFRQKMTDAAVALKLALRTFKLVKNEQ